MKNNKLKSNLTHKITAGIPILSVDQKRWKKSEREEKKRKEKKRKRNKEKSRKIRANLSGQRPVRVTSRPIPSGILSFEKSARTKKVP